MKKRGQEPFFCLAGKKRLLTPFSSLESRRKEAHREFWRAVAQIQRQQKEQARAAKEAAKEQEPEPTAATVESEQNESNEVEVNTSAASESVHITQDNQSELETCAWGRHEDRPKNPGSVLRDQRRRERKRQRDARKRSRAAG